MTRIVDCDGDILTVKPWMGSSVLVRVEQDGDGDGEAAVALSFDEVRELIAALRRAIGESPDAVAG